MNMIRSEKNPIIRPENIEPSDPGFKVVGVFNCGVTRFKDEVLLLMRVAETPINDNSKKLLVSWFDISTGKFIVKEFNKDDPSIDISDPRIISTPEGHYLTSISHLRIARSKNGIDFKIDKKPAMFPENIYERSGMEDPRITQTAGKYYISYSAVSDITGITTCLASTDDFIRFKRHGVIFLPDNKDVVIFPEKIGGMYYALSRPSSGFGLNDIWISESPDLVCWSNHKRLLGAREGYWDDGRIGAGAVPFRVEEGWLEIYHGASKDNRYCLGAVLLDSNEPSRIIARSEKPIMEPRADYEQNGFFGNAIFTCGVLHEEGRVKIYYGAADTFIAYAEIKLTDILSLIS
ncbi:MAG: glycoside hydrolase family 130 protein [Actinobacteria bacterium]|nr:glycoside hydrolase family 130 protein [Actinomycetota bacterium]